MLSWESDDGNRVHLERKELRPSGVYYIKTATTSDIVACLTANPEVAAEVHAGLHEHLRSGVVHSAVFEAMRDRAERDERDLAALHELIHEQSGLDEHHPNYSPEWAVQQMSERWGAESAALIVAERERDEARAELAEAKRLLAEGHQHVTGGAVQEERDARIAKLEADVELNEQFRREWGEAHHRLTTLTDELLGPASTMPLLALVARLEGANLRSRIAKLEAVVPVTRELYEAAYLVDFTTDPHRYSKLASARIRASDVLSAIDEDSPRAIVDSDTAAVGAVDSTPVLSRLASAEPGDAGSIPARSGSSGTPGPTAGATPAAGAADSGGSVQHTGSSVSGRTPEPPESSSTLDACDLRLARLGRLLTDEDRERIRGARWTLAQNAPVLGGRVLDAGSRRCPHGCGEAVRAGDLHVHGSAQAPTGMVGESGGHAGGRLGGSGLAPDTAVAAYSKPAGSSHDPLAALEAAVGRPLTAEDRDRIQGVVARLQPDAPRGGLLPEPLERGPRPDYSTRSEDGFITRGELVKALKELEALRRYWYFRNGGCDVPSYDDPWPEFAALAEILQNAGR